MQTITVTLTLDQVSVLIDVLKDKLFPPKPTRFEMSPERVRAVKDAGLWNNKKKRKRVITKFMQADGKAPWGYKKDGTPKAKPGRKV